MAGDGLVGDCLVGDGLADDDLVGDRLVGNDLAADGFVGDGLAVEVGEAIVCVAIVENVTGKDDREEVTVINRELPIAAEDCGGVEGDGNTV